MKMVYFEIDHTLPKYVIVNVSKICRGIMKADIFNGP